MFLGLLDDLIDTLGVDPSYIFESDSDGDDDDDDDEASNTSTSSSEQIIMFSAEDDDVFREISPSAEEPDSENNKNSNKNNISLDSSSSGFDKNSNSSNMVETTIRNMEKTNRCLHPHHWHSFRPIHLMVSVLNRPNCFFCEESISIVLPNLHSAAMVVRCAACDVYAHRQCSVSRSDLWRGRKCPVNATYLMMNPANDGMIEQQQAIENLQKEQHAYYQAKAKQMQEQQRENNSDSDYDNPELQVTPLDHLNHKSFRSVNSALEENVIAHFSQQQQQQKQQQQRATSAKISFLDKVKQSLTTSNSSNNVQELVDHDDHAPDESNKKLTMAALAGGIAGGLAGLAVAGPAGWYAGAATASVFVESSVTLGVVVAGIATGRNVGQKLEDIGLEILPRRVLTMGEHGTSRKVLLVRPHIEIDPLWENSIMLEARKTAPPAISSKAAAASETKSSASATTSSNPLLQRLYDQRLYFKKGGTGSDAADSDILQTDEHELPIGDKVTLLVNRALNDKSSLPGHVYRYLLEAFEDRCRVRQAILESYNSVQAMSSRARRDDVHAVIKHVTATLLEQRSDFSASPQVTELTAIAVEGLVFGRLYSAVYEEIVQETRLKDEDLQARIVSLKQQLEDQIQQPQTENTNLAEHQTLLQYMLLNMSISEDALNALRLLPDAHSPVDKLHYCVRFLECISQQHLCMTKIAAVDTNLSADSLLKMVCQHLILHLVLKEEDRNDYVSLPEGGLNAEVVFLEEFARDEQLLRGREGYALVTLQASLHFLNMSTTEDLIQEIFEKDDKSEKKASSSSCSSSSSSSCSDNSDDHDICKVENETDDNYSWDEGDEATKSDKVRLSP